MASKTYRICALPGDGIGPEIIAEAKKVLAALGEKYDVEFGLRGPPHRRRRHRRHDRGRRPRLRPSGRDARGGARLRRGSSRRGGRSQVDRHQGGGRAPGAGPPCHPQGARPLPQPAPGAHVRRADRRLLPQAEVLHGVDLIIVRELTGGLYFGGHERMMGVEGAGVGGTRGEYARDVLEYYSEYEVDRVVRWGLRRGAAPSRRGPLRGQGQRARYLPHVARGGAQQSPPSTPT